MRLPRLPVIDVLLFLLCIATVAGAVVWTTGGSEGELFIEIEASDEIHLYPLAEDRKVQVVGPVGVTDIAASRGEVSVVHSDCREKICISMGEVGDVGGWIACLPNRVFVRVVAAGQQEADVDAAAF